MANPHDILKFWFEDTSDSEKWQKNPDFDKLIENRFGMLVEDAANGKLSDWRDSADGSLAEIILLDQFSRNIYRDTPKAFANDELSVQLAFAAVEKDFDKEIDIERRGFFYLPFMHSEDLQVHQSAEELYRQKGLEDMYDFEIRHLRIIEMFGRYPHRNEILGRKSTSEELAFLITEGSGF